MNYTFLASSQHRLVSNNQCFALSFSIVLCTVKNWEFKFCKNHYGTRTKKYSKMISISIVYIVEKCFFIYFFPGCTWLLHGKENNKTYMFCRQRSQQWSNCWWQAESYFLGELSCNSGWENNSCSRFESADLNSWYWSIWNW